MEDILSLNLLETADLTAMLQKRLGISPANLAASFAAPQGAQLPVRSPGLAVPPRCSTVTHRGKLRRMQHQQQQRSHRRRPSLTSSSKAMRPLQRSK